MAPKILGKELPAWSCDCGAYHRGPAKAMAVIPAGQADQYSGQETLWYMWSVRMVEAGTPLDGYDYSTGLSSFVPPEELAELFISFFPRAKN